jgi:ribokinase
MDSLPIAVVGSLMMDLVVRVPRLPVLGESLFGRDFAVFGGGKGGNQALAAARAGAGPVAMIGRVGDDPFGRRIVETLQEGGVDCRHVTRDPSTTTGVAVPMVLDDGRNSILAIPQANLRMTAADVEAAAAAIRAARILLVQFEVAMEATLRAMQLARDAGVRVVLNPAPIADHPAEMLALATYIVVNEVEAAALAPEAESDHVREARALLARGPAAVFVTLGERGSIVVAQGVEEFVAPHRVDAVDTVGAGDAYCGALAVALAEGRGLVDAARFAGAAGAVSVTRAGAAASLPTRSEIDQLLAGGNI